MDRLLIKGGLLATFINEAYETLKIVEGDILLQDGFIAEIGKDLKDEETVIDARGKLILPGFVNAHSHSLASILLKGLIEGQNLGRLGDSLPLRISKITEIALSALSLEEIESLLRLALAERLDGGTTTLLEQCSPEEVALWKKLSVETGIRVEALSVDPDLPAQEKSRGNESRWIGPLPVENWEPDRLKKIREALRLPEARVMMNMPETHAEMEAFRKRFGTTPIRHLSDADLLGPRLTISHCLHADQEEQRLLRETGTRIVHCRPTLMEELPEASLWLRPSSRLLLAVGTDFRSGEMLDLLRELALLINLGTQTTDKLKAPDLFYAATIGGARALGREDLGRIVEGYRGDLLVFDTMHPRHRPFAFPLISAIHHGSSSDIETVIIGGRIVKQGGSLSGLQHETIMGEAEEAVWKAWGHCRKLGVL